jgi:hypothetical protein
LLEPAAIEMILGSRRKPSSEAGYVKCGALKLIGRRSKHINVILFS